MKLMMQMKKTCSPLIKVRTNAILPLPGALKMSWYDHLWGHAAPCGSAGKIDVHKEHEQWDVRDFTQVQAAEKRKTLLLPLVY